MIYINPNSSAENSAHSSKRGSRAGIDVEEDGDEAEEARLRSMLLKQIGRKRSKSRDSKKGDFSNPDSPNTVMINPVKINPTVMHRNSYLNAMLSNLQVEADVQTKICLNFHRKGYFARYVSKGFHLNFS